MFFLNLCERKFSCIYLGYIIIIIPSFSRVAQFSFFRMRFHSKEFKEYFDIIMKEYYFSQNLGHNVFCKYIYFLNAN